MRDNLGLTQWRNALSTDRVWGVRDALIAAEAAIGGGVREVPAFLDEQGSIYGPLVSRQVEAIHMGIVALTQIMMLVEAEQAAVSA